MYCSNTNHPVLRVLKPTPRQGTPMRVHKRPPELYYTMLYYAILHYTIHCTIICYTILYYTILHLRGYTNDRLTIWFAGPADFNHQYNHRCYSNYGAVIILLLKLMDVMLVMFWYLITIIIHVIV